LLIAEFIPSSFVNVFSGVRNESGFGSNHSSLHDRNIKLKVKKRRDVFNKFILNFFVFIIIYFYKVKLIPKVEIIGVGSFVSGSQYSHESILIKLSKFR